MIKSDFDSFWNKTLKDLESTAMSEDVIEDADLSARDYNTYKVVLNSFENTKFPTANYVTDLIANFIKGSSSTSSKYPVQGSKLIEIQK